MAAKPRSKLCACCGARTAPLMQYHNQDTGYGLCSSCADWIGVKEGSEYLREHYGVRGQHIEEKI